MKIKIPKWAFAMIIVFVLLVIAILVSLLPLLLTNSESLKQTGAGINNAVPNIGPVECEVVLTEGSEKYDYYYNIIGESGETTSMNSTIKQNKDGSFTRTTDIVTLDILEGPGIYPSGAGISFTINLDSKFECRNASITMSTAGDSLSNDIPCQNELRIIEVCGDKMKPIRNETINVTAGEFNATVYSDSGNLTNIWIATGIPIPLKMVTPSVEVDLVSYNRSFE